MPKKKKKDKELRKESRTEKFQYKADQTESEPPVPKTKLVTPASKNKSAKTKTAAKTTTKKDEEEVVATPKVTKKKSDAEVIPVAKASKKVDTGSAKTTSDTYKKPVTIKSSEVTKGKTFADTLKSSKPLFQIKTDASSEVTEEFPPLPRKTQFMKVVEAADFSKLQNIIFSIKVTDIASKDNSGFLEVFLQKFPDLIQREKIADNILDKIKIYLDENKLTEMLAVLKADLLIMQARNSLDMILKDQEAPTVLTNAQKAVQALEMAYAISNGQASKQSLIMETLDKVIQAISDPLKQFELLELALIQRKANLPDNQLCLIDLFIKLGSYSTKFKDLQLKAKVMSYSKST